MPSALLLIRNEVLPTIWAADVFKIDTLHICGRNRKAAECADRIQGSVDFFKVNLVAGHFFTRRSNSAPSQSGAVHTPAVGTVGCTVVAKDGEAGNPCHSPYRLASRVVRGIPHLSLAMRHAAPGNASFHPFLASRIIRAAMEIDKEKLRDFVLWLWGIVEKLETDLLAHEVAFVILKASGQTPQLDELLEHARKNPSPELAKRQQETRETVERLLGEQNPGDALMRFLQTWKPKGPIN